MKRLLVVGAGPAGLGTALLLKRQSGDWSVEVRDRRGRDTEVGFGVTMPGSMLTALDYDGPAWRVDRSFVGWKAAEYLSTELDMVTIERTEFVRWLGLACEELGVEIRYETPVRSGSDFNSDAWDVVLGADGVRSTVRQAHEAAYGATLRPVGTRHTWLSASRAVSALETHFVDVDGHLYLVFAYPYREDGSTFIVECTESTWRARGFDRMPPPEVVKALESDFASLLDGASLRSTGNLRWDVFQDLGVARWSHGNIVLAGDAAHTANFAGGFGTLLALQDAECLARHLATKAPAEALTAYGEERAGPIQEKQREATSRHNWHARILREYEAGDHEVVTRSIDEVEQMMRLGLIKPH